MEDSNSGALDVELPVVGVSSGFAGNGASEGASEGKVLGAEVSGVDTSGIGVKVVKLEAEAGVEVAAEGRTSIRRAFDELDCWRNLITSLRTCPGRDELASLRPSAESCSEPRRIGKDHLPRLFRWSRYASALLRP